MTAPRRHDGAAPLRDRKQSHLELCVAEPVEHAGKTTLFEQVELLHDALPELAVDAIDVGATLLGRRLRAPLVITGMTGGTAEAFAVNRDLASLAEECGVAFGLGSQRIMQRDDASAWTFQVRRHAPSVPLLANLGLAQAARQSTATVAALIADVEADALCLHLNPAQELIQSDGDRDFRGGLAAVARLCAELPVPVIVKETGCGISGRVGGALRDAGVSHVDVSGAGGTSWVRVEALRGDARGRALGTALADWGIPTAASLLALDGLGLHLTASGGIRSGVEMAKAIALGAQLCGAALPVYRAYRAGGLPTAREWIDARIEELRAVMLLTGAATLADLRQRPVVLGPQLKAWAEAAR